MQHINLISQVDRATVPLLAAAHQLRLMAFLVVALLLASVYLWRESGLLSEQLARLESQDRESKAALQASQAKKQALLRGGALDDDIRYLEQEIVFRRELLKSVDVDAKESLGFKDQLISLARQNINGMWFTDLTLDDGGNKLALQGLTQRAELVPRFIQKLRSEESFEGHSFNVFKMKSVPEKPTLLSFELRTDDLGEGNE